METEKLFNRKYKELYLLSSELVDKNYKTNAEAVKAARDQFISDNFKGKFYRDLTLKQLERAIAILKRDMKRPSYATARQQDLLRFYAISCAVENADLRGYTDNKGNTLPDGLMREILRAKFNNRYIEPAILQGLYKNFINPIVNKYLTDGGYRASTSKPEIFYYKKLKSDEIQYLINRFMKYLETTNERNPVPYSTHYSIN